MIKVGSQRFEVSLAGRSEGRGGFAVVLVNRYTGHGSLYFFDTRQVRKEVVTVQNLDRMASLLKQANSDDAMDHGGDLVIVTSVGDPECTAFGCRDPAKDLDKPVTRVALTSPSWAEPSVRSSRSWILDPRRKSGHWCTVVGESRAPLHGVL